MFNVVDAQYKKEHFLVFAGRGVGGLMSHGISYGLSRGTGLGSGNHLGGRKQFEHSRAFSGWILSCSYYGAQRIAIQR